MGLSDGMAWEKDYGGLEKAMGHYDSCREAHEFFEKMTPEQRAHNKSQNELIARLTKERDEAYRLVKEAKEVLIRAGTVLQPLLDIADAYDANDLDDEARKFWGPAGVIENERPPEQIELYTGRGGKRLLTLEDCLQARTFVKGADHGSL